MSKTKWIGGIFAALLVAGAGTYYWLFLESGNPVEGAYTLDIEKFRTLADEVDGPKPTAIQVEKIGGFEFPGIAVVAGDSWASRPIPVFSYRLIYPGRTAIIDSALDAHTAAQVGAAQFDEAAYTRMVNAMADAQFIVITHEHMDHIGGLVTHPQLTQILPATRLTVEQINNPDRMGSLSFPDGALENYAALDYQDYAPLAPGVVVVKSPGHTPGSQMVYVQLADGTEYLFLGDVAWVMRNVELTRERARLMTWYFLKEERQPVLDQLAGIKAFSDANPQVHLIPGHDGAVVDGLVSAGLLNPGFQ